VLHPTLPILSQKVKAQTILLGINLVNQALAKLRPLGGVHQAFEDGLLHTLAKVAAFLRDMPESFAALGSFRVHVVGHNHEHSCLTSGGQDARATPPHFQKNGG
jgi:hypothetical protein